MLQVAGTARSMGILCRALLLLLNNLTTEKTWSADARNHRPMECVDFKGEARVTRASQH